MSVAIPAGAQVPGWQSALSPKGPHAAEVLNLSWVLFIGAGLILLLVILLTLLGIRGSSRWRGRLAGNRLILGGGVLFPLVALSALLSYGLSITRHLMAGSEPAIRIQVIGERWWWRVHYLDEQGRVLLRTTNEIRIPAGEPVVFLLQSADVIHSFWVPSLAGKLDMIPGHTNRLRLEASEPGVLRGLCAEYCGAQHARMAFYLVAVTPDEFQDWLRQQRQPARQPLDPVLQRGLRVFQERNCGLCHRIQGTRAQGDIGPDLTHVGSRLSIGAGLKPTNAGTLAGWISSSQHLKPGNLMPAYSLPSQDLTALAAYLDSLK